MAQRLATLRTPAAYAAVSAYARRHTGDAAAAAYLALGHAYLLDGHYAAAEMNLRRARHYGGALADYADFLGAEASFEAGDNGAAAALLRGFVRRYPDSIFDAKAPELEADVLLAMNNPTGAREALLRGQGTAAVERPGYQLAEGQVELAMGRKQIAVAIFRRLLLSHPLTAQARVARQRITDLGAESALTVADLRSLGDAYYRAGRYAAAAAQYRVLAHAPELGAQEREGFAVAEAACELHLGRLTWAAAEALPDTNNESGARRLYLLIELARDRSDTSNQQRIVTEMEARFPYSEWLAEALFSSGNMYLLRRDYPTAIQYYLYLAEHFPAYKYAATAHWRAGWLTYRLGQDRQAARLFAAQIRLYPTATDTVSALYWQGRLYQTLDHAPALAAANYRAIIRAYPHYFYAQMARDQLAALGHTEPVASPQLDHFRTQRVPQLETSFPMNSPHLAMARLLANAGLNEYIPREIAADPGASRWSALVEAQIYSSYGEYFLALRAIKRAVPYASTASFQSIPLVYWKMLYPTPWWNTIVAASKKNGLDPYLVASLIRQESEFNPSAVSYAHAYGLMQLLPRVGRKMAREEGMRYFRTFQLLDPEINIRLGTRYLRQMLDEFGGVPAYALAAYNAGDYRVVDWRAHGPYSGIDEFVESIPFTQTRNYVEAVLRNEETYRAIDEYAGARGNETAASLPATARLPLR